MRIVHILNELNASGAETMLRCASNLWTCGGVHNTILSTGRELGPYAQTLADAGYEIIHLPLKKHPAFFWRLFRLLRGARFDAVHIHTERVNVWFALVARLAGVQRIFRTVHSRFEFAGTLRVRRTVQRWVMRRWLKTITVSISPSVLENENRRFSNPTVLIPNWYDSTRFFPLADTDRAKVRERFGLPLEAFVIITVGNCSKIKNHGTLLRGFAMLPPSLSVQYLHVGRENVESGERELADSLGIAGNVRFIGLVEDIAPLLHAADVFVMPSLYEGFGVAAIEAMAAGLPAILAAVPGLQDFSNLGAGIWWAKPTPEALAEAICAVSALTQEQRRELGIALSRRVKEGFGLQRGASAYKELYVRG